ncbi:hypothetical protein D3C87_1184530 [compost metagenome]
MFFLLFEWRLYRLSSLCLASYAQWLQFQIYTMLMEPGARGLRLRIFLIAESSCSNGGITHCPLVLPTRQINRMTLHITADGIVYRGKKRASPSNVYNPNRLSLP